MKYEVCEKFISINGEGRNAGSPAVFIRLKGCNLSCPYCDTKWANKPDAPCEVLSEEEIYSYIKSSDISRITLTGGEPLIHRGIDVLIKKICSDSLLKLEIETNGSVDISPYLKLKNRPSFTLDYKTPSSGMEDKMFLPNLSLAESCDTVKFVCGSYYDLERTKEITEKYKPKAKVYISPVFGSIKPVEIAEFIIKNRLNDISLQLQLHKIVWEPDKRGV